MINIGDKIRVTSISGKKIPKDWTKIIYTITSKTYIGRELIHYNFVDDEGNNFETFGTKDIKRIKDDK